MQNGFPESDPKLQKQNPSPKVTTGFVDPCIIYLETTLPGEIPILLACWAGSSTTIQKPGFKPILKLTDVVILKWRPIKTASGWLLHNNHYAWNYSTSHKKSLFLISRGKRFIVQTSTGQPLLKDGENFPSFTGSIRFIDQRKNEWLQNVRMKLNVRDALAHQILANSELDWQSITEALASLQPRKTSKNPSRRSIFRHLVSKVFKKKPKLAAV